MREADARYFERIEADLEDAIAVAEAARERGGDPTTDVEIPVAKDMADRVEKVLGIEGVADRVRELEAEYTREEAALALVEDFVDGSVGDFDTPAGTIEGAVRTAVALLTEGVVAAPIEGIDRVEVLENDDGTEFVNVYYAGPIRSAGGTAQALSVLVADYARALLGVDEYRPRDAEVGRYAEEVSLYDDEVGLQYSPGQAETAYIAEHMPIMLDGEPTGDEEVSGHRDLDRVDTNSSRGGMCLVIAEGIALKAPKIQRYTRDLDAVDWPWLADLIDGTYAEGTEESPEPKPDPPDAGADEGGETDAAGPPRVEASKKYLRDLIAGRPVFSHPSEPGGFRLRYGRARNHGFATAGVHPATMHLVEDFLATGTQLKTELPGKAAGVVPVDSIEGPTVRLANGDVRRIDDPAEAREVRNGVEAILDLGEYLVNYGEFVENNHRLAPASYTVEWWVQEFEAAGGPVRTLRDRTDVALADPGPERALEWAREYDAPLHPRYTYLWHDVAVEDVLGLAEALDDADVLAADGAAVDATDATLAIPRQAGVRSTLEALLVEHTQGAEASYVSEWRPLVRTLGFEPDGAGGLAREWTAADLSADARGYDDGANAVRVVDELAPFAVRERAPTRVGTRMGRPEKSETRELSPAVHTLFPIGDAGGDQRSVEEAVERGDAVEGTKGEVTVEVGRRDCTDCGRRTFRPRCPDCGGTTRPVYECPDCDREVEPDESGRAECPRCETAAGPTRRHTIDLAAELGDGLAAVGERASGLEILKGVKGLTSREKAPEPMEKGVLRAKHGVSAFKDGTVRYDMTDLPVTAVRPAELDVSVEQFRALGYEEDVHGDPLEGADQLVDLKVQDVVLSEGAAAHLRRTADFVDDLLTSYYGLDPYYEVSERDDLVGELVFGMAPHTSAATVGRIVGFTTAAVGYAHPYFHAAKRRNCFHPDTEIRIEDDDGTLRTESLARFVEQNLENPVLDDFGARTQDLDGEVRVQSLADDGSPVRRSVLAVSKHPAPDHLVRIETDAGRSITVTPDHSMVEWRDDAVREVDARAVEPGDVIPAVSTTLESDGATQTRTPDGGAKQEVVERVELAPSDVEYTYCLTVDETNRVVANGVATGQCDGDEDCVMLLMDGLLNFSKTYLPDKRGGSVAADSRLVAVDPADNVRFMTFEEFWHELESPLEVDGKFHKRTCYAEGWRTYAFDENQETSLQPIEKAIRYTADPDETMLEIETQFGRSLTITDHHSLFRYDDGIDEVAGSDLEPGDLIVAPRELPVEARSRTIDVVDCVEEPYVFIDDHVEDLLRTAWETTDHGSRTHRAFRYGLSYRLSKNKIAYDRLEGILETVDLAVPRDVSIGRMGSSHGIPRTNTIDEDLAWLLGLFVAEGTLSSTCPAIHNADEYLVDHAAQLIEETLGHEPGRRWSNKAYELRFPAVFEDLLFELGFADVSEYNSAEKVVPDCILQAPRDVVVAFLRGFIAGDGSYPSNENYTTVAFHTTSDDVADGIVFLLHRLGIVANVSERTDRPGNRQDIFCVTVSGGATDNPLHRLFDGDDSYLPKSLVVAIPDALMEIREMDVPDVKRLIPKYLKRRDNISLEKLREIVDELAQRDLPAGARDQLDDLRLIVDGDLSFLRIESVNEVDYDGYLYDLQVGGEPIFTANWLYAHNSMDAPLVMSSRIDPAEIDDEAHNVDVVERYPREFYEATRELADPDDVDVTLAASTVGTDRAYAGFRHTHDTSNVAAGPDLSAYKTIGSMEEKMDAQLALSRRIRAVEERDVAERLIEYHFLPDLIGNLRAFSRQETRCHECNTKYRRPPLSYQCRECGGDVHLTVHEGSVTKYMDTALRVAAEFGAREYTKQRLEIIERSIERVFEDDQNKQSGIADFM